ncbi:MAG: M64 family metallopeptidase [Bacteroidales bacterium]|nr:M64 family metallopeptidase [Bacteroidales bacterium]
MKTSALLLFIVLFCTPALAQSPSFDQYFTTERLRIDLVFTGNSKAQDAFLQSIHKEPVWAGSRTQLIDPFGYGEYYYKIFTPDGRLLFSKGFNSLFQEWRTTEEAKHRDMAFNSSVWMPFPKSPVVFVMYQRIAKKGTYEPILEFSIDPSDALISNEKPVYSAQKLIDNGPVENKVDLLFVAEGYTREEMDKFLADAARFSGYLFDYEPFKSRRNDFNIWTLSPASEESGPDIPQQNIWKRTCIGASFNTFYVDRYMTAPDYLPLAKMVSGAPFDAIYVIVNTQKYGGGGIYNYYGLSMADHRDVKEVFVHEFGHSFAGLADEYYTSQVAYIDMYPLNIEPWEPNITTMVDFGSKWKDMMEVEGVGLFEGGGYMAKGVFRPADDCRMHTNTAPGFCPVCQRAISRMIDYYCQ